MKNHLLLLRAQTGNGQDIQNYIQKLQEQIQEYENYHHTGNEFLDGSFMELLDISTIFGNALDNAIEESEKLPEDRRLITVRANRVRDMLVITVRLTICLDWKLPDIYIHRYSPIGSVHQLF